MKTNPLGITTENSIELVKPERNEVITKPTIVKPTMRDIAALKKVKLNHLDVYEKLRQAAREDFFFFVKHVLAPVGNFNLSDARHFKLMHDLLISEFRTFDLHRWGSLMPAWENEQHNRKLGLLPRMHGKTKVGTIAMSMWLLYKNPNLRILVISSVWDNAKDMLGEVKELYVRIRDSKDSDNPVPYIICGDCIGEPWNEDRIKLKTRTIADKTASLATAGIGKEVTSKHFDIIICDDLVGKENTETLHQIKKTKHAFASLTEEGDYFIDRETVFFIWGTTWHYADIYADLLDPKKLAPMYDILRLRCWDKNTHDPLFPEKFTKGTLERIRKEKMIIDPIEWNCQWLNEPIPTEEAIFNPAYIQYYEEDDIRDKHLDVLIMVDPALSEEQWSDYTAIVPVGIDRVGRRYVLPYMRFRESDPSKLAANIIHVAKIYKEAKNRTLVVIGVEEGILYNTLMPILSKFAPWLPLQKLKIKQRTKPQRVLGLQPFLTTRRLYLRRDMIELKQQMIKWGKYDEDDVLDALAYHVDLVPLVVMKPQLSRNPTEKELFWAEQRGQQIEENIYA
jgi:hypothetical protein